MYYKRGFGVKWHWSGWLWHFPAAVKVLLICRSDSYNHHVSNNLYMFESSGHVQ